MFLSNIFESLYKLTYWMFFKSLFKKTDVGITYTIKKGMLRHTDFIQTESLKHATQI